jgi:transposase InsO family protein
VTAQLMSIGSLTPALPPRRGREEPRIDSERAAILAHLSEVRRIEKRIDGELMAHACQRLGVGPRQVRRMVFDFDALGFIPARAEHPHKIELDQWKAQVAYFVAAGVASKALDALKAAGDAPETMCERTFQRRVNEWDPALVACAKGGYRAMVKHQFFNLEQNPFRAYAYGSDHTFLPIQVIPGRGMKPVWPWLTTLIDLHTRVVLAYRLTLHTPNTDDNLHVLIEGIRGWYTPDGMFVGGKPRHLRTDRGADYLSKVLSKNLLKLEIDPQHTQPYSSWQNGVVERLNGTIDRDFAPTVPGYHPGGEAEYTRRVLKTPINPRSLLTVDTLDVRLGDFFAEHNNRPHSALNGRTPLEAWAADEQPLEVADRETLAYAMPPRESRILHHYGIEIRGRIYSHPSLGILRKQNVRKVDVRFHDHDIDHIEVFVDDTHECTATRSEVQPQHQRFGVLSIRAKQRRIAEALLRSADRERVLQEHERLREEGVDESEWPLLPDKVVFDDEADEAEYGPVTPTGLDALEKKLNAHLDATKDDQHGDTPDLPEHPQGETA